MNYFRFHLGDYGNATAHLSWLEDTAYMRLLRVYYTTEQPLPGDLKKIYRMVRADTGPTQAAVRAVLDEFFVVSNEKYLNKRAEVELKQHTSQREANSLNIKKRWDTTRNTNLIPPNIQYPIANKDKNKKEDLGAKAPCQLVPLMLVQIDPAKAPSNFMAQAQQVVDAMNRNLRTRYRVQTPAGKPTANGRLIIDRLRDGYDVETVIRVYQSKAGEWYGDDRMQKFLRPGTLFRAGNFEDYLGQLDSKLTQPKLNGHAS